MCDYLTTHARLDSAFLLKAMNEMMIRACKRSKPLHSLEAVAWTGIISNYIIAWIDAPYLESCSSPPCFIYSKVNGKSIRPHNITL